MPIMALLLTPAFVSSAFAAACSNAGIAAAQEYAQNLPDCRAYEQVSPTAKNFTDASGGPLLTETPAAGGALRYFSVMPFPGTPGASNEPTYVSDRSPNGWSTESVLPRSNPGRPTAVVGLTADLTKTVVEATNPALSPEGVAGVPAAYLRDNRTGTYELIAAFPHFGNFEFAGASADGSRLIFESSEQLVPSAPVGLSNLYEWDEHAALGQRLRLVGLLPGDIAAEGSVAGPGGPAVSPFTPGGATQKFYVDTAISADGTTIFFTDASTGAIYVRRNGAVTSPVSGTGSAVWQGASPDGSGAIYSEGEQLFEYDTVAATSREITTPSAGFLGVFGMADDRSRIYFVATGALAGNTGPSGEVAEAGKPNLYEWRSLGGGTTHFIARLDPAAGGDGADWRNRIEMGLPEGPDAGGRASRVTPTGETVIFSSIEPLTGYDNGAPGGPCEGEVQACSEIFRYDATADRLTCVSCNVTGAQAVGNTRLVGPVQTITPGGGNAFLTRNLSSDGLRVYFETADPLVPADTNGQKDVYEWEAGGAGTCTAAAPTFNPGNGGCVYLISSGRSPEPSYFGDASASGADVFFFTRQSLVAQDTDNNIDAYDAKELGGIPAQNLSGSTAECAVPTCSAGGTSAPSDVAPTSAGFVGAGNLLAPLVSKPAVLSRAQHLAAALRVCRKQRSKPRRRSCERKARARFPSPKTKARKR
jgi:hypothetical protein